MKRTNIDPIDPIDRKLSKKSTGISRDNVFNYALIKFNETNYSIELPRSVSSARRKMAPRSRIEAFNFPKLTESWRHQQLRRVILSVCTLGCNPETINCCNYNNPGV